MSILLQKILLLTVVIVIYVTWLKDTGLLYLHIRFCRIFGIYIFTSDGTSTDSISINISIYYRIKPRYIGLGKCYSFPFVSTTVAIATATATAKS